MKYISSGCIISHDSTKRIKQSLILLLPSKRACGKPFSEDWRVYIHSVASKCTGLNALELCVVYLLQTLYLNGSGKIMKMF